jgi:hypothetical protein
MASALATTWPEVHAALSTHAVHVERNADVDADGDVDAVAVWAPYKAALRNPDAPLNTAQYLFQYIRSGILVVIRGGKVVQFAPFANKDFTNAWGERAKFLCGARTVREYAVAKASATGARLEAMLPLDKWWLNAGIACNVMPAAVWGDHYNHDLLDMLEATAQRHALPDAVFFLNKRDYPVFRKDGQHPYSRFVGSSVPCARGAALTPVFSFYTGSDTGDWCMPVVEDWVTAKSSDSWARVRDAHPWHTRKPVAVFRGSGTGPRRWSLARVAHGHPFLDVGITAVNARDRVWLHKDGETPMVHWVPMEAVTEKEALPLVPPMPLEDQAKHFQFIVYADGHCAASRYGTLMHTGCCIVRIESHQKQDSGHLWLFDDLVGVQLGDDAAVWGAADHVRVRADLADLVPTMAFLVTAEGQALAQAVARNSALRAPTCASICAHWARSVTRVHDTALYCCSPEDGVGQPWFDCTDKRYASLHVA